MARTLATVWLGTLDERIRRMTDTITDILARLSATGRVANEPDYAAIRERTEANLTPAELEATRMAILDDMRKRGISAAARNAVDRTLFG